MAGKFILSLDCEGKWGIADHLTAADHSKLNDRSLIQAYRAIMEILDRYDIKATFAVVGCFGLNKKSLLALPRNEITERFPYTEAAFKDATSGGEGWSGSWIYDMMDDRHEIGLHGITHTPFDQMDENDVRFEFSLLPVKKGQTFIFPRNKVAHTSILKEFGIVGYRLAKPSGPIRRFVGEFDLTAKSEAHTALAMPQPIPAGHFVNWRSGARKLVPLEVTRRRCRNMLNDAARNDGVVHFWTHPENMATAPGTLKVLDMICEEAAKTRESGRLTVVTQKEYCKSIA